MPSQDACEVIHELILVSRELLRLGDTGQDPAPSKICAVLRVQRDVLQAEMRAQLRAAATISGENTAPLADQAIATVRPPISSTRLKAIVPPADSPSQSPARRKERP